MALGFLFGTVGVANSSSIALQQATATFSQVFPGVFTVDKAINGTTADDLGWAIYPQIASQTAVFETSTDVGFAGGSLLTFTLIQTYSTIQHTLGHFRISVTTDNRDSFADGLTSGGDVTANWSVLDPDSLLSANGSTLTELGDYSILASGFSPNTDTYTVTATTALTGITGIRLEALTDLSLPYGGPGRYPYNGNFVLSELQMEAAPAPVPAPATMLLFGTGIAGLAGTRLRRKK